AARPMAIGTTSGGTLDMVVEMSSTAANRMMSPSRNPNTRRERRATLRSGRCGGGGWRAISVCSAGVITALDDVVTNSSRVYAPYDGLGEMDDDKDVSTCRSTRKNTGVQVPVPESPYRSSQPACHGSRYDIPAGTRGAARSLIWTLVRDGLIRSTVYCKCHQLDLVFKEEDGWMGWNGHYIICNCDGPVSSTRLGDLSSLGSPINSSDPSASYQPVDCSTNFETATNTQTTCKFRDVMNLYSYFSEGAYATKCLELFYPNSNPLNPYYYDGTPLTCDGSIHVSLTNVTYVCEA
ncbi:6621_t:CDS:2, partial [Acaulospora colombiana]